MPETAERLSAESIVDALNMLFTTDPAAMYRLANLRVACHNLQHKRPDLAYHMSDLEFPVMGAIELINVLLNETTDKAIILRIDKLQQRCSFELVDKIKVKQAKTTVFAIPERL